MRFWRRHRNSPAWLAEALEGLRSQVEYEVAHPRPFTALHIHHAPDLSDDTVNRLTERVQAACERVGNLVTWGPWLDEGETFFEVESDDPDGLLEVLQPELRTMPGLIHVVVLRGSDQRQVPL